MDFDFDGIVKEVNRWSGILNNTTKEILETQQKEPQKEPKKESKKEPKKEN